MHLCMFFGGLIFCIPPSTLDTRSLAKGNVKRPASGKETVEDTAFESKENLFFPVYLLFLLLSLSDFFSKACCVTEFQLFLKRNRRCHIFPDACHLSLSTASLVWGVTRRRFGVTRVALTAINSVCCYMLVVTPPDPRMNGGSKPPRRSRSG